MRYAESGNGQAVVMIHGNAGSIEDFVDAIETLSSNYRVIAVERPGHGKTDRPNGKTVDVDIRRGSFIKCFPFSVLRGRCTGRK